MIKNGGIIVGLVSMPYFRLGKNYWSENVHESKNTHEHNIDKISNKKMAWNKKLLTELCWDGKKVIDWYTEINNMVISKSPAVI